MTALIDKFVNLIVIGSSLIVTPAAFMPSYAVQNGAKLVIINLKPTPLGPTCYCPHPE